MPICYHPTLSRFVDKGQLADGWLLQNASTAPPVDLPRVPLDLGSSFHTPFKGRVGPIHIS
jgi:hypothetical protein